jgi:hypothetical protein
MEGVPSRFRSQYNELPFSRHRRFLDVFFQSGMDRLGERRSHWTPLILLGGAAGDYGNGALVL